MIALAVLRIDPDAEEVFVFAEETYVQKNGALVRHRNSPELIDALDRTLLDQPLEAGQSYALLAP